MCRANVTLPQALHLFTPFQQLVQFSLGNDLAVLENDDPIGAAQGRPAMRNDQAGCIALLKDGSLIQVGTPEDLYAKPRTTFAATFIGSPPMNLISARLTEEKKRVFALLKQTQTKIELKKNYGPVQPSQREITVGVRPEHIHFSNEGPPLAVSGRVRAIEPLGREFLVHVQTGCGTILVLSADKQFRSGDDTAIGFDPDRIHLFEGRSKKNGT